MQLTDLQIPIATRLHLTLVVSEQPYLYVHLAYPAEVVIEKQLRQALRFPFDAPATCAVHGADSSIIPCKFVDISLSGARLDFSEKLPTTTSRIRVSLSAQIANAEQQLELDVVVKSQPEENTEAPFFYGVTFTEKSVQQQLLLEALCIELQVRKT